MNLAKLLPALFILSLTACTHDRAIPYPMSSDHASIQIAEAARSVSRSMHELARIQEQATPPVKPLLNPEKFGMRQSASIDWSGPVEPLLKRISHSLNYRLRVLGPAPAVPVIITMNAESKPMGSILRDIDYQASHKAHVAVYPRERVLELRYAKG